jgi:hypothetical protein
MVDEAAALRTFRAEHAPVFAALWRRFGEFDLVDAALADAYQAAMAAWPGGRGAAEPGVVDGDRGDVGDHQRHVAADRRRAVVGTVDAGRRSPGPHPRLLPPRPRSRRGALLIEPHPAQPAQLFAAAGAAGAAVQQVGHHHAGAKSLVGDLGVGDHDAPVPAGERGDDLGEEVAVVAVDRADEAALAAPHALGRRARAAVVGDERRDRAEDLEVVHRFGSGPRLQAATA